MCMNGIVDHESTVVKTITNDCFVVVQKEARSASTAVLMNVQTLCTADNGLQITIT